MATRSAKQKAKEKYDISSYDKEFLVGALEEMMLIRRFEEKAAQMYGLRKIGGFFHAYNGQEAISTAVVRALDMKRDYILTAYRDHGHAISCGIDPKYVMAELYGKITGVARGKGGSMHMFDAEKHMLGGNGIVGAQIPVATGVAFAEMYRRKVLGEKNSGCAFCFFGDGAVHQGAFHESLNMASVWNLPAVYVVENNQYGMGTAVSRVSAVTDFDVKAVGYAMSGTQLNGMDFIDVYEGFKAAATEAIENGRPTLIDCKTYRYKGHSISDPAKYRTKDELESFKARDPITLLQGRMHEAGMISDDEYREIDQRVKDKVQEAVDFADSSDEPALETMYEDIYVD